MTVTKNMTHELDRTEDAKRYIQNWTPDYVRDYVADLSAAKSEPVAILDYGRELYDQVQGWWTGNKSPPRPADIQEYIARSSLEIERLRRALASEPANG